jgi:hypothetical protein
VESQLCHPCAVSLTKCWYTSLEQGTYRQPGGPCGSDDFVIGPESDKERRKHSCACMVMVYMVVSPTASIVHSDHLWVWDILHHVFGLAYLSSLWPGKQQHTGCQSAVSTAACRKQVCVSHCFRALYQTVTLHTPCVQLICLPATRAHCACTTLAYIRVFCQTDGCCTVQSLFSSMLCSYSQAPGGPGCNHCRARRRDRRSTKLEKKCVDGPACAFLHQAMVWNVLSQG